jgi:choline dehydrogenase-like flavoprotein
MAHNGNYDVIIIGSGAGGGTLAYKLAPTGKKILLIERGDYVAREKDNWSSLAVVKEARYNAREVWSDSQGKPLHPHTNYYVGGNTKFYGAALFRLRERDFQEIRHHGGVSPAWPISYPDIEPYYTQAEKLYQVMGSAASIQQTPGRRRPCLMHAKSDAQVICVDPALTHSNASIMTNAYVSKLETSPSGREVTAVHVQRGAEQLTLGADIVVSSCGAINSAALLLRSANDRHPRGLANGSDAVGRHYMGHNNSVLFAISREPNPTVFQKTIGVNDFYFESKEWEYPMGHISFVGKFDGTMFSAGAPKLVPGLTLDIMAKHSLDFWLTSEDLPDPNNRVSLDRDGKIVLSYTPNNLEGHKRLNAKLKDLMQHVDCQEHIIPLNAFVGDRIPLAGVAHQNGTVRFGHDPASSALDVNCKAHEVDNLYVVDGSFFPSSAAVNPALTIMANALRVGDHLIQRMI